MRYVQTRLIILRRKIFEFQIFILLLVPGLFGRQTAEEMWNLVKSTNNQQ